MSAAKSRRRSAAPSIVCYVEDSCGDQHLFTVADPSFEDAFRRHARYWTQYIRRNSTSREYAKKGISHRLPCTGELRVVVEHRGAE